MSQSQEISQVYQDLKKINNGLDVEDLMYGENGFYYSVYPNEWNKTFGRMRGTRAPLTAQNKNNDSDFCGDPIYCERLWEEFKSWAKNTKGIRVKDYFDVDCEARGLPTETILTYDEVGIPEDYENVYKDNMEENEADLISNYLSDEYGYCQNGFSYELNDDLQVVTISDINWDIHDELEF